MMIIVNSSPQSLQNQSAYLVQVPGQQCVFMLPISPIFSDTYYIVGNSPDGWTIQQNDGQTIYYDGGQTTTGTGGSLSSTLFTDSVQLTCINSPYQFTVITATGTFTLV